MTANQAAQNRMAPKSIVPANWEIPAELRQRLGDKAGRQRALVTDGHLLLVLHRPPKKDETERVGRYFWRKPDGTWLSNELGGGSAAVTRHLTEFSDAIDRFDRLEEAAQNVTDYFHVLESVTPLHRSARNQHAALQQAREQLPDDRDLINFRDRAYEIERNAELLLADTRHGVEFAVAKKSEEQADAAHQMAVSSHRLNLLVAFFFPIATLATIFGSNLRHPLEEYFPPPLAFYIVLGVGLFMGLALFSYLTALSRARFRPTAGGNISERG
jgi:hypothetical protein